MVQRSFFTSSSLKDISTEEQNLPLSSISWLYVFIFHRFLMMGGDLLPSLDRAVALLFPLKFHCYGTPTIASGIYKLEGGMFQRNLDQIFTMSELSKYFNIIFSSLGICLTWTVLVGCLTVAGKYFKIVPQNLHESAKSLSMFYIPATQIWLLAITIPYFALLICAVISDGFALVMALKR